MLPLLLLLACGPAPVHEDLVGRYCAFWGCTGVDPATAWCHGKYDAPARLHERRLRDLGYVLDEAAVDGCLEDLSGGPDGDEWCECGCTSAACCACTGTPMSALNHLYGVPAGTHFEEPAD